MTYVLDTNVFTVLGHYFPNRFPSLWKEIDELVAEERLISVREVFNELEGRQSTPEYLEQWMESNKKIFLSPTEEELLFVKEIFKVRHFQRLINEKQRLKGTPVADPFVIASAKVRNACAVTEEEMKPNAAKIPNVCQHFDVAWTNLEGLMECEGWEF